MRKYLSLPVHEKMTYAGHMKAKQRELRRELKEGLEEEEDEEEDEGKLERPHRGKGRRVRPHSLQGNPALRMAMIKGENIEKESTLDFITKKREMFLLEYSLSVKKSEIKKLEDAIVEEERRLKQAEQMLEDDAILFEEFLKENDKTSVEAIRIAEQETRSKLEKMTEIKRLTTEMVTIKSEISKNEEILKEYNMYKDFLFRLSPLEWQEAQRTKVLEAKVLTNQDTPDTKKDKDKSGHKPGTCFAVASEYIVELDEPELYFSEPQQLLDLMTELEEQNLSLIQNSRETEEALEELRHAMKISKKKMATNAEQLTTQINIMTQTIAREKERAAELELKARLFSFGKFKTGEQDSMLDALGRKVEEVYRCCVGDKTANLSTLQMLANIENRVSMLLESMESIPPDTLEKVEKIKDKERRVRQRDEKLQQQKDHQEERLKKALERAQCDIKRTNGRKLMARSKPVAHKIKFSNVNISEKEEIHNYFFT
ncbi:cilia- and flagella-associated protein 100 [Polymixia lowei]